METSTQSDSTIWLDYNALQTARFPSLQHLFHPPTEARSLCARPFLEVYDNKRSEILFIGPLARQDDFYVPEVLQEEEEYGQVKEGHGMHKRNKCQRVVMGRRSQEWEE